MTRITLYARYSSEGPREASIEDQCRNGERYAEGGVPCADVGLLFGFWVMSA